MGALADYKRAWGDHRDKVKAIYAEYDKALQGLGKHKGSQWGNEQIAKARAKYDSDMAAARSRFGERVDPILQRMKANLDRHEAEVVPPTAEQLAVLQAVQYMTTISVADYVRYAEQMDSSDVASRALHDLASSRTADGAKLPEFKGKHGKAWEQAKELSRMAKNLNSWDGCTARGEALRAHIEEQKSMGHLRGIRGNAGRAFDAAAAAEVDPTAPDFYDSILGVLLKDDAALQLLDD